MKEHLRNKLFIECVKIIMDSQPDIDEFRVRRISQIVSEQAIILLLENNKELDEHYKNIISESEKTKKMFREHIENLQKETKTLMNSYKTLGMVTYVWDDKSRKNIMKTRTSVLADTVAFLNNLNSFVTDFYKNVYKIEESNNEERAQLNLF